MTDTNGFCLSVQRQKWGSKNENKKKKKKKKACQKQQGVWKIKGYLRNCTLRNKGYQDFYNMSTFNIFIQPWWLSGIMRSKFK